MRCASCGAQNNASDRFCTRCGALLSPAPAAGQAPSPEPPAPQAPPRHLHPRESALRAAERRLERLAGTQDLEGFSLRDMFGEVFVRRSSEELDEYLVVGTAQTTPDPRDLKPAWPKPWLFARVLLFVALLYGGLAYAVFNFGNIYAVPGMLMLGALAVPLATLILFFELNVPRNVPLYTTLMLMAFGGVFSIIVALFGYKLSNLGWLGASSAGIVEESGKLLVVALLMRQARYPYILNGLLFGAAVGAGFAWFESGGYAFDLLLKTQSLIAAAHETQVRALLSPFAHVAWTAIAAGALWRAKGAAPMTIRPFLNGGFWKAFLIPVVLHMLWNSPLPAVLDFKFLTIGVIAWFVVFGLVQQGLWQIRDVQRIPGPENQSLTAAATAVPGGGA
jgi:RsiW-degrading membrane proteinase PrsW (M82 family)